MATFIDPENLDENNLDEDVEFNELDTEDSTENVEQTDGYSGEQDEEVDELPEKYKGKSTAEIIQMHKEAEKLLGRHSSEVGELRKIVDDFVKTNLDSNTTNKQNESTSYEEVDFFDDPKRAVEQAIANNPALAEVKNLNKQLKEQAFMQRINAEFPEHNKLGDDPAFVEWIQGSNIRGQMANRAINEHDWESAEELLSTWRRLNKTRENTKEIQKADLKQERQKASTGSAASSGESKSRKMYRRTDIINLMRTDPERYSALSDEITKAYAEGRVK
jgi:hypothetical protein